MSAVQPEQGPALRAALAELSDADPLIAARSDDDGLAVVSLYGRVQQEVIATTLDEDYGIEVRFADASVLHVERPRTVGAAMERLNTDTNPYHATIGSDDRAGCAGSGVTFVTAAPARDMPLYLFKNATAFSAAISGTSSTPSPWSVRLAGDRLRGHLDRLRLQRRGRTTLAARPDQHVVRLPPADPDRAAPGAATRRHGGLRAGAAGADRDPERRDAASSGSSPDGARR